MNSKIIVKTQKGYEMNMLHTEFLVHWTGRDFHDPPGDPLNDSLRDGYINRLVDYVRNGLWMKPGTEKIYGSNATWIEATIPRTCFTEIKLTQARFHAMRYGRLGVGVHRSFVLERQGNPVFYVQNGDYSAVVENLDKVRGTLEACPTGLKEFDVVLAYVKGMSDQNSSDFHYYDELEWRIVHLDRLEGKYLKPVDRKKGIFRIILEPEDIKLLVFPDMKCKEMALNDSRLIDKLKVEPIFVTLDDCNQF